MIITKRNITFEKLVLVRKRKLHTVRLISGVTKRYMLDQTDLKRSRTHLSGWRLFFVAIFKRGNGEYRGTGNIGERGISGNL